MTTDPLAGIRQMIADAPALWAAEQARRLAAALALAGATAELCEALPVAAWGQAVDYVNATLGKRDTRSPQALPDIRRQAIALLADWFDDTREAA